MKNSLKKMEFLLAVQGLLLLLPLFAASRLFFLGLQRAMIMCSAVQKQGMQLVKGQR